MSPDLLPSHLLGFVGVSLGLAIAPGPDVLYVLSRGVSQGSRSALAAAVGFSLGNVVHTLAVAFGLAAVLAASPFAYGVIRYAGVLYLIYLGVRMMKRASGRNAARLAPEPAGQVFRQSLMANLLNPKVIIFFLSIFPLFLDAGGDTFAQTLVLGAVFIACTFIVFGAVALLAGRLNRVLGQRPERQAALQQLGGAALLVVAVWVGWPSR